MKKAIVTGAGGFIGGALTAALSKKQTVYAVLYSEAEKQHLQKNSNVIPVVGDLNDWQKIKEQIYASDIDVFYHLAWGGISSAAYKDINIQKDNISMSISAAKLAESLNCKKFVFSGTNQEYLVSECLTDRTITEASVYGMCKLCARKLTQVMLKDKMEFNATAFTNVFGPGDYSQRTANFFIKSLLNKEPLNLITGDNQYDWTYVDDAVAGLIAVGEKGKNGKQYYIGSRNVPTFKEILIKVRDVVYPDGVLNFGAFSDPTYTDYSKLNLDALYNDTGFECRSDFKESILKTAEWVKENL